MFSLTTKQKAIIGAISGAVLLFFLILFGVLPGLKGRGESAAALTMWGVFDESVVWEDFLGEFQRRYPRISITYTQVPFDDYEKDLIDALAAERGPDLFYVHHTWLPKFRDKLAPMPQGDEWMTFSEYRDAFVDVTVQDFTRARSTIYAVPLSVDTLALYYNKDLLNAAGIADPPRNWEDFRDAVQRLALVDANGAIRRAGAAVGSAHNVNRSTDILALLMAQTFGDVPLVDPQEQRVRFTQSVRSDGAGTFSPGVEALRFYTDFANPGLRSYTWNRDQDYSIDAFIEGEAAMMLNYPHHIATVRARAPQMRLGIARAPQPASLIAAQRAVDYAGYFGVAVARTDDTARAEAAWRFLSYLSEPEFQRAYADATGHIPARRDLLPSLASHPDFGVFAQQALTARSWYQPDNVAVETILADAIESVLDGTPPHEAIRRAEGQVTVLLKRALEIDPPAPASSE